MKEPSDWIFPGLLVLVLVLVTWFIRNREAIEVPEACKEMGPKIRFGKMKLANQTATPNRNDVVIYRDRANAGRLEVGRIIAVAGQSVQVADDVLYINDEAAGDGKHGPNLLRYHIPRDCFFILYDQRAARGASLADSRALGPIHRSQIIGVLSPDA